MCDTQCGEIREGLLEDGLAALSTDVDINLVLGSAQVAAPK